MMLWVNFRVAWHNLIAAKMRAFLAILGVLVGTAAVVALISSSQLATNHALAQFKSLGTNLLAFYLQPPHAHKAGLQSEFTLDDVPDIERASDQVRLVAPYVNTYASAYFHGQRYNASALGVTQTFFDIAQLRIARGRVLLDLDRHSHFCVIGATLAAKIRLQGVDPLWHQILVGNQYFTIIGLLQPWQSNLFIYADLNRAVLVPLIASTRLSDYAHIRNLLIRLQRHPTLARAQHDIQNRLAALLPGYQIQPRNPQQIIKVISKERQTFSWLLIAIGSISLIVGGIGVMNIMLVSVVERRREVGIRMAIGARQWDILMMFLVESVILTVFGGMIGIVLGVVISFVIAMLSHWAFQIFVLPIVLGFLVSLCVGIIAGIYPALRASFLDPIDTLAAE